ncbi:MAG TPA: OmpA family protein [Alphaproteobacteria bacterium]|nr:OmpA family protein [Alphaproteobacteria bacterium]
MARLGAIATGLLALAAWSAPAAAQHPPNGFYIGGEAGATYQTDQQISGNGVTAVTKPDIGMAILGTFGYRFWDDFRIEEEPGFRRATISKINGASATGNMSAFSAMSNLLYDIPFLGGPVVPFVGVGIGFAYTGFNSIGPVGGGTLKDNDTVFVMQGIAGVSYNINPNLAITATYRYFAPDGSNVETAFGTKVQAADQSHTFTLGVRWSFGEAEAAPKPAPAAAPAPAPAPPPAAPAPAVRSFVVFFAFDSATLDDSAKKVVAEASAYARQNQLTRIEVTGHTDRSGPEKYNERLSLRRANAVKAEMIRLGIAADQIAVAAKGMADPAVPTPIGVREPRNRRAEITF